MRLPSLRLRSSPLAWVIFGTCLLAVPFHLRPDNFIVDDGYFYPQIARYIAAGQGSTFNGILPTNGYHPLWMFVCVLAASVTRNSSALVQILSAIQDLLLLACLAVLVKVAQHARMRGGVLACAPLLFLSMVLGIWRLLETDLALALQVAVLLVAVPALPRVYQAVRRWRSPLLGLLLGLAMLARLDLIFLAMVIVGYRLTRRDTGRGLRERIFSVSLEAVIAALVVVPYLLWNLFTFHHLLPISGAIKSTFPHPHRWAMAPFLYPVFAAVAANATLLFQRGKTPFKTICLLTAAATALEVSYALTFGELAPWYLTTGYLSVSLCVLWVFDAITRRLPRIARTEGPLAAALLLAFFTLASLRLFSNFSYTRFMQGRVRFHGSYVEPKRALAKKLSETLPGGSRIFIFDAPGGVAFRSGMSVIPSDGLVSDYAYNFDIVREGFLRYTADRQIDYFIAPYLEPGQHYDRLSLSGTGTTAGQTMRIEAPLTRRPAGSVSLTDATLLFRFRDPNPEIQARYPVVGVWRLVH